jgi:molybdate transport system substrate-binding protein
MTVRAPCTGATIVACIAAALLAAGCGDSGPVLTISADTALKDGLSAYAQHFTDSRTHTTTGASAQLTAAISSRSAKPDVNVAADPRLLDRLFKAGRVGRPVRFATDELVIATHAQHQAKVTSIDDLTKPGIRIAIATPTTPTGAATNSVLRHEPVARRRAILANIHAREPDTDHLIATLKASSADAILLYHSQIRTHPKAHLTELSLAEPHNPAGPARILQYAAAVVTATKHPDAAKAYIYGLLTGPGADAINEAGFSNGALPLCGTFSLSLKACPTTAG